MNLDIPLQFLSNPPDSNLLYSGFYDPKLVLLSILIAIFASHVALSVTRLVQAPRQRGPRLMWLLVGALVMGGGTWAMHFIGMLALRLPCGVSYDTRITLISILPGILASGVALQLISRPSFTNRRLFISSLLLGLGIGVMHYTGMSALRLDGLVRYNPYLFGVSILVAVALAWLALSMHFRLRARADVARRGLNLLSAVVLGGAVSGMHYTAMAAAYFLSDSNVGMPDSTLNPTRLATMVSAVTTLLITLVLVAMAVQRHLTLVRQLRQSEQKLRRMLDTTQEGFWMSDVAHCSVEVNSALCEMLQRPRAEIIGRNLHEFLEAGSRQRFLAAAEKRANGSASRFEMGLLRSDGSVLACEFSLTAMIDDDGNSTGLFALITDITQRKQAEEQIRNLAFYDVLTQLPNRRLLLDRLGHALASSHRSRQFGAILFLDLDNFKSINDTQGHDVGDLLLSEAAGRLQACVRDADTVARLGGDEFVVLLEGLHRTQAIAAAEAESVAENLRMAINRPFGIQGSEFHSTPSIGISLFNGHQASIDELLKRADVAMYQAKDAGRNAIRFFDPAMQASLDARIALLADLRRAMPEHQMYLDYQAQVDLCGNVFGAEVLLRWRHPQRGLISPAEFIPLAEESNLILDMGHWVLQTACAQIKAWRDNSAARHLRLAVNVSARQFRQPDFVQQVETVMRENAIDPAQLKLELTESLVLDNVADSIAKMQALKALGVGFAMDDFGTGHSSLSYLKQLPLDQLKIDQSFVRDIATDPNDAAIVQTIIVMANSLGLDVIAEGVENQAQLEFLRERGCPAFQGYLFSRPVALAQFEALLSVPHHADVASVSNSLPN
jgi:diguanylate cyclase (GGDEF)-like protein/PAS domain S-box-containing protein